MYKKRRGGGGDDDGTTFFAFLDRWVDSRKKTGFYDAVSPRRRIAPNHPSHRACGLYICANHRWQALQRGGDAWPSEPGIPSGEQSRYTQTAA